MKPEQLFLLVSPVLDSLQETWSTVTSVDSVRVWVLVGGIAGGVGLFISWELIHLWEHLLGYSSIMTVLTTIPVLLLSHFCLSYLSHLFSTIKN